MRKTLKSLFCFAIVMALLLSCLPTSVFAASTVTLPTAQVSELNNKNYTFAMNFKADQVTAEQLEYYGEWYADFVLTINRPVTFNANGTADGYLAGQYDAWSMDWVKIPATSVSLGANQPLRIMEFGAELLGKKGLKYTYREVYETVKDFDCGVYFTPEFLSANLDLEVTLELRMYNPENEAESYTIGNSIVFENPCIAKNTSTGKAYEDINKAIIEANAGDTVVLLGDAEAKAVSVYEDITLNLNGYTLVADYMNVYGSIVDRSADNSGRLVVDTNHFMFRNTNKQLPIYTENGYCFADVVGFNQKLQNGTFGFQPLFEAFANPLIAKGYAYSQVSIQVKLQWAVVVDGETQVRTQYVEYSDNLVKKFASSYNANTGKYGAMFTLKIANAESYEGLNYTITVASVSGVAIVPGMEKVDPQVEIPTASAVYGQTLADVTLPEGFAWKDSSLSVGNAGTNSFVAVYTPADTDKYNVIEVSVPVTVAKADTTVEAPVGLTAVYGDTLADVILPAGFAWVDATLSVGEAGSRVFTAIYTPENTNYNTVEVEVVIAVNKADMEVEVPTGLTAVYGDTLADVILPAGFAWADATLSVGNAGNQVFTAIYTPENANYNTKEIQVIVTVKKADLTVEVPTGLTAVYGDTLADVILPTGFTWKNSSLSVGNAGNNSFAVIYTPEDENYNTVELQVVVFVEKANPVVTAPTGLSASYGATLSSVILPAGFTWKDGTVVLGIADGNTFTAIYTPEDPNYNTVEVSVSVEIKNTTKFAHKFPNTANYLYRVGNVGNVSISTLFKLSDGITADIVKNNLTVTITAVDGTSASGVYTAGSAWNNGTIKFEGTGVVKVTITDNNYCNVTTLYLEVVDATNATTATNATSSNIVLLNDVSASTLSINNGFTFYGNQFTITFNGDGSYRAAALSYGFVTIENGILDSTKIKCRIFPYSYLYTSSMVAGSDGRYPYGYSAIVVDGNSTISNSYVYGARNNIAVGEGNVVIKDTITECGSVSNIQIKSSIGSSVTLDNVTTIQYLVGDGFGVGTKVIGFGILVGDTSSTSYPTINIKGNLNQYNWVTNDDRTGVSDGYVSMAIDGSLAATNYQHTNANGATTVNMGLAFLTKDVAVDIKDTGALASKYKLGTININGSTGRVYSIASGSGIIPPADNKIEVVMPDNREILPTVQYNSGNSAVTLFAGYDSTAKKHINRLTVDLDNISGGSYGFKFADVKLVKYGKELSFIVLDANGNTVDKNTVITLSGLASNNYTFVVTDDCLYDQNGNNTSESYQVEIEFIIYSTKTSIEPPKFSGIGSGTAIRLYEKSWGTEYWRPAYEALTGVTVTYWSSTEGKVKTINLSDLNTLGTISGSVWTYTCADFTITLTGGAVHTDGTTIVPKVAGSKLYFASMNKHFGTGTSSRDVIITYSFTDNNANTTTTMTKNVAYSSLNPYVYSDFENGKLTAGTGSGGGSTPCVTPDTLVTMADGTKKQIKDVKLGEEVIVWNFYTGKYEILPVSLIDVHYTGTMDVLHLYFEDGTVLKVLGEHGIYDVELNTFIFIDLHDVQNYLGHSFVKQDGNGYTTVKLVDYKITTEETSAYTILSAYHYNVLLEDMFTVTPAHKGDNFFNPFTVYEGMKYDEAEVKADIEKYGLYTYEEFADVLTEEQFELLNIAHFKVSVGKGLITHENLIFLIVNFINK